MDKATLRVNDDRLWSRLMEMAKIGATTAGGSNRQALSDDDAAGRALFCSWAEAAGCSLQTDSVGNLFARRPGRDDDSAPLVMGSHLDTQPTGGRFDGVYGVLGGLEVVETLNDHSIETAAPVEVAVWANEEGSRFPRSMMGSGVWGAVMDLDEVRALTDESGISVGQELDRLGWVGPLALTRPFGHYLELHIEQGPILEADNTEVGIVTGVQGLRWYTIEITGFPAHAGPTPMDGRRDPARALAKILSEIYDMAAKNAPWARATPAQFHSEPTSPNTVPSVIRFSLDLRHPDAEVLEAMEQAMRQIVRKASAEHDCEESIAVDNDSPPIVFDESCIDAVETAAGAAGFNHQRIVSGAGHDACYVAAHAPTSMIFIPCKDGLSHNEAESIEPDQATRGANVLLGAALKLLS
ncbi:MAG: Zn-dependent hydrolase, partial [Acidimicrobiales bacterium]